MFIIANYIIAVLIVTNFCYKSGKDEYTYVHKCYVIPEGSLECILRYLLYLTKLCMVMISIM